MSTLPPFAHSIGVVIGIDHYGSGIPELRTAENDARHMGELLATAHGYDVTALLNGDATQANITTLLKTTLPARVGKDDRVLFYFAGHGVARDGDEGPAGYLLPADAKRGDETTYLDMPLIHDALLALDCRHMLVVLDSCFSGAFRWSGTRAFEDDVAVVHQEKYDRFVHDPAWQVITSASQDQKAIDQLSSGALGSRDGDGAHSPFALALFDGIGGASDLVPKGVGDGLVTATELYLFLEESLQNAATAAGKEQTPRLWPLKKHGKGEYVFFVPGRDLTLPPAPPLTFDNNPWCGLASYDAGTAGLFFGRDKEIADLRTRIASQPFTVVLGASGTGKSSLVKAGVVPKLAADGWTVLPIIRPGTTPLVAIAQAVSDANAAPVAATATAITARVQTLATAHAGAKVLLVIDQFEELITLARRAGDREAALTLLATLTNTFADTLRIVITIRTDFEPNFDRSVFGERWRMGRYVVPPMSRENLRAVIEKPAAVRVLYFDPPDLVETLLDEVVATPGALPLLSFALSEMYISYVKRQSNDRAITRADYDALGGVVGALRARAESEYAALDEAHQGTLRRVMLRLVTADGGGLARRRVTEAELDFADNGERARAADVVRRLTEARLLVGGKEPDGESFVEPAHDALVRGWGRLLQWVREESEARFPLAQQQRMSRAALEWDRSDAASKSGQLWSDSSRSAQLTPLVRQKAPFLNRREMAFAQRSIRGRLLAIATAAAAVLAIAAAGAVAVVGGLRASARAEQVRIGAIVRTATAMVNDDPLVASQLLGNVDSTMVSTLDDATSLALLGAALELRRGPQVLATFDAEDEVTAAVISPDGRTVATGAIDNVVRLWRADGTGTPIVLRSAGMQVTTLKFSPAGDRIAVGDADGGIHLWRIDGTGTPVTLQGDSAPVIRLQFSHDGRRVLVTHEGGALHVWNADGSGAPTVIASTKVMVFDASGDSTGGDVTLTPVHVRVDEAEFADDDKQVVTAMNDSTVQFWPSAGATPKPTRTVRLPGRVDVTRIAVSPDGKRVAIGGRNAQLIVIGLSPRVRPLRLKGHHGDIAAVGWSPTGAQIVSTATDTGMLVWSAATGKKVRGFRHNGEAMQSADFSPDGQSIVTTSPYSFQATVWSLDSTLVVLPGQTNELVAAEFGPDSRRVLTAAKDGSVRLWALPTPPFYSAQGGIEKEHPEGGDIAAAAFSPDAKRVAMSTRDGIVYEKWLDTVSTLKVIDEKPGTMRALAYSPDAARLRGILFDGTRRTWTLGKSPAVRSEVNTPVTSFALTTAFAADGRHALAMTAEGEALVWDVEANTAPMHLQLLPADSMCAGQDGDNDCVDPTDMCAALSDDGRLVAACQRNGPAALFRVPDTLPIRTLGGGNAHSTSAAFSRDGTRAAVGYADGSIRVFRLDIADTGRVFTGHRQPVTRLDFAPGNQRLLSAAKDGTVRIWDVVTGSSVVTIRPKGLVIQRAKFTRDGRRVLTLGAGETDVRVWNADGSGGFVSLPAVRGEIDDFYPSADGRWLLTTSNSQAAQLLPLDPNLALKPFRAARTCLPMSDRRRYLMESAKDAAARHERCEGVRRVIVTAAAH